MLQLVNKLIKFISFFIPVKSLRKKFRERFSLVLPQINKKNIGKYTYWGPNFYINNPNTKIGKFVSIAGNVRIGATEHPKDKLSTSPYFYLLDGLKKIEKKELISSPCNIGNDVWIGQNVLIKDGINIADGAIIGAGSIVVKDVEPYSIVAGVPAKLIRYRFNKEIIDKLLKLKWWELDDNIIAKLPFDNINEAIEKLDEIRK